MRSVLEVSFLTASIISLLLIVFTFYKAAVQRKIGPGGWLIIGGATATVAPLVAALVVPGVNRHYVETLGLLLFAVLCSFVIATKSARFMSLPPSAAVLVPTVILGIALIGQIQSGYSIANSRYLVLVLFVLAATVCATADAAGAVIGVVVAGGFISCISGIAYFTRPDVAIRSCRLDKCGPMDQLFGGLYPNENALGMVLVAVLPFILILSRENPLLLVLALQVALGVYISGSRSSTIGLVAVLIAAAVVLVGGSAHARAARFCLQLIVAVGFIVMYLTPRIADRDSLTGRALLWEYVEAGAASSPILGSGYDYLEHRFQNGGGLPEVSAYSAHNQILDIYLVSGVVGVILFLYLMARISFTYSRLDPMILLPLVSIVWVGVLERPMGLSYFDWLAWTWMPMLMLAVAASAAIRDRSRRPAIISVERSRNASAAAGR